MPYTFDDLCKPNFEYFEYHRAEQLEFDFILTKRIFTVFGESSHTLADIVKAEEPRTQQSFQEYGRHLTSCLYRKLIKDFTIPSAGAMNTTEYILALHKNYLGLIESRCFTPEHIMELEQYFINLFAFAELNSPPEGLRQIHWDSHD